MKKHISATIEQELLEALHRLRRRERRSLSNLLETAVAEYVENRSATEQVVSTPGSFAGRFSRRETYAKAKR